MLKKILFCLAAPLALVAVVGIIYFAIPYLLGLLPGIWGTVLGFVFVWLIAALFTYALFCRD